MNAGLEAVVELICGIFWVSGERMLFLREDKSVRSWYLRNITLRDCGQQIGSAVKPDSKQFPPPCKLQLSCTVTPLRNLSEKGQWLVQ